MKLKKYLMLFLMLFIALMVACKEEGPDDEVPPTEADPIEAVHQTDVDGDEVSPYVIVQSILNENKDLIYSLTYISIFPKPFYEYGNKVDIVGRYYDYYQVDYVTDSGSYDKYFHQYDYLDSQERSYGQNFMPEYNFKEQLKTLKVLVRYRFTRDDIETSKEIKFQEDILKFDSTKFIENNIGNHQVELISNRVESEEFYRYKIKIDLDDNILMGHFDIQTWVEINNEVYPFIGFYHYRPNHGDIKTESDIEVSDVYKITKIYYQIRYYSNEGKVEDYYYQG